MNAKKKGGAFERKVAKALSLWVSNNKNDDLLWRSATSGGKATVARRKDGKKVKTQMGDLIAVDRHREANILISKFFIECKHVKNLRLDALVYGLPASGQTIIPFWHKLIDESKKYGKQPMLIARQNGTLFSIMAIQKRLRQISPLIISTRFEDSVYIYNFEEVIAHVSFLSFNKNWLSL